MDTDAAGTQIILLGNIEKIVICSVTIRKIVGKVGLE